MAEKAIQKAMVFIDGSNFYFKLNELTSKTGDRLSLLYFDFKRFAEWLADGNELVEVRYYIGVIKRRRGDAKSEELYAGQQKLIGKLQQQNIVVYLQLRNIQNISGNPPSISGNQSNNH